MRFQLLKFSRPLDAVRARRPGKTRTFSGLGAMRLCILITAIALMIVAHPLLAQTNGGSISGSVLDPQGNAIAGATVHASNVENGAVQTIQTTSSGNYRLDALIPGKYQVSVEMNGFQSYKADNVTVLIGNTTALDIQLQVGSAAQSVTVTASSTGIQTETSDIGTSVDPELVSDLPLFNYSGEARSIVDFIFLVPGVVGGENDNKIAGGQVTGSTVQLDGGAIDSISGANFDVAGYTPSPDAVQEFTLLESGYPAQYGRTTGGITIFNTQTGTNQYHGTAYDIFRNTALDANSWWNNLEAAANPTNASLYKRPVDLRNEFGVTAGGPLSIPHLYNGHNRTFGFFSWEQLRQHNASVNISTVPTIANRNGDFTATLTKTVVGTDPCTGNPIYQGEIFDPATTTQVGSVYCRTPFAYNGVLNTINPARFSTVAQNALTYEPAPQNAGQVNNYAFNDVVPRTITEETIRIDHIFGANDKIFASYNPHEVSQANEGQTIPGPASPAVWLTQTTFLHDAHFGYDHAFSGKTFNHVVLSLYRYTNFPISPASQNGIDYIQKLGLGSALGNGANLFPTFTWGENYSGLGSWLQYEDYQNHIELADNVLHTFGKHTLNIGYDHRWANFARNFQLFRAGWYNFSRNETAGTNGFTTQSGNGFASFLLGQVSSTPNTSVEAEVPTFVSNYDAIYLQDDYKPFPNLTLNLGLRYDVDQPFSVKRGVDNNWDPTLPDTNLGNGIRGGLSFPQTTHLSSRFADVNYHDFGPRLGFAWSPRFLDGKSVIRGNYGIIYGAFPMNVPANGEPGFSDNPNFSDSLQPGGFTAPFNLDSGFPAFQIGVNTNPFQLDNTSGTAQYTARSFGKVAMVQNYGLEIQQQFSHALVMSLAYAGDRGNHLASNLLCLDCLPLQYYSLGSQLSQTYSPMQTTLSGHAIPYSGFTGSLAQALQPFPQVGNVSTNNGYENDGQSSYNALFAKLQRNFTNGLSLLVSYSWSKSLTDADTTLIGQEPGGAQDPFNFKNEKTISALDYPQVFVASYVYQLPFGKGKQFLNSGGAVNEFLGGWEITGIHNLESGSPSNFGCATGMPGNSPCFRFSLVPGVSPYTATSITGHSNPLTSVYLNDAAFVDPNSNARIAAGGGYQYGTLPLNYGGIRYPTTPNSSFGFIKRTAVTERTNVEFRAELSNAFNQHRLGAPNQSPNSTAFGVVNGIQGSPRNAQMTLRVNF